MKELQITEFYSQPHSAFPEEVLDFQAAVKQEFALDTEIYILPRLGIHHDIYPEIFPIGVAKGLAYKDKIYVFPEFSTAFKELIHRNPNEVPAVIEALARGLDLYINDESLAKSESYVGVFVSNLMQFVNRYRQIHDMLDAEVVACAFNFLHGYDESFDLLYEKTVYPVLLSSPEIKTIMLNQIVPIIAHEAGHVWCSQIFQDQKLSPYEKNYLNTFLTKELLEEPSINHTQNAEELIAELKNSGLFKLKLLIKSVPDISLHRKIIQSLFWSGLEEDVARAISLWKTANPDQLYDNPTLISYFGSVNRIIWKGNCGIKEYLEILQHSGLDGFIKVVLDENKILLNKVDELLLDL